MARAAVFGRLNWRLGEVVELIDETPRVRSIVLDVPDWTGHRAGQHVDVRLTAEDGYQAQRSFSIASAPEDRRVTLTVERLPDGEVSTYLRSAPRRDRAAGPHTLQGWISQRTRWIVVARRPIGRP